MTTLNRQNLIALQKDIETALAEVMKRHDVNIQLKGCTYTPDGSSATIKLQVYGDADRTMADERADRRADALAAYRCMFPHLDLDREFTVGGDRVKITGYNTRARKTPFIATIIGTTRGYRLSEEQAAFYLKKAG